MADDATLPTTKVRASAQQEALIREAVRTTSVLGDRGAGSVLAEVGDAEALCDFLTHPSVYLPIYTLPSPLTPDTVRDFIAQHIQLRARGEGLLFVRKNEAGAIIGYSDVQIWPEWAAGELGGALHPDLQSKGQGTAGAANTFDWMFSSLHLNLICATAALDNIRTEKMLTALGFTYKGEIDSTRPDGTKRRSKAWDITREDWAALRQG